MSYDSAMPARPTRNNLPFQTPEALERVACQADLHAEGKFPEALECPVVSLMVASDKGDAGGVTWLLVTVAASTGVPDS